MTHLVEKGSVKFENGSPTVPYDKIYRCFQNQGNGLLFRLVQEKENLWSFYNDTKDSLMKVKARFGPYSKINILGRASLTPVSDADSLGPRKDPLEIEVDLEVYPGKTEPFISGLVNGFTIGFQSENLQPEEPVDFENGTPDVPYTKIFKCFKNSGNGLLFRLVDSATKKWYFYNDTSEFLMKVKCEMDSKKGVKLLGKTKEAGVPAGKPDGVIATLDIHPRMTEPFLEGNAGGYALSFVAEGVKNDLGEDTTAMKYINGQPNWKLVDRSSKAYRCFKEDGNGLLFRFIDEKNRQWCFYNDTVDLQMKVIVTYPQSEASTVEAAPGAQTEVKNGKVEVTMSIPPLTTSLMLKGLPGNYEVEYSAASANRMSPEERPCYVGEGPNSLLFPYAEVFRCFKDRGNGLMFRLVDETRTRWGFYNDTPDTYITAKVNFAEDSKVIPLGQTKAENDREKGMLYVLTVAPGETVPFVQGEMTSYVFEFTGKKSAPRRP